ncbi:MAG: DUF2281 domain-containing protein [Methylococcaceae bacterium]
MTVSPEELVELFFSLPEREQQTVIDFIEFLHMKIERQKNQIAMPKEEQS